MSGKNLRASVIIGGGLSSSFRSAMSSAKGGLKGIGDEIARVERQQRLYGQSIQTFGRMGGAIDGMRRRYENLAKTADRLRAAQSRLALANDRVDLNRAARGEAGGQLLRATAQFGAIAAAAFFPVREAVRFETAMLGVAKQVDGARDSSGKLTAVYFDMARQIQRLGRELPMATTDIADMVTAGARMGIAREHLIGFVRDAAMMSTAFEMPAGELADSMGKIAGIFKIPVPAIGELGDAINYLDDNALSRGGDIIRVLQGDLAGASTTMGLSAKNAAALASTFLHMGESAERADTAAAGMLRQLQVAKMQPKRFQLGVKMLGMTADQLQKGMVDDPQAMILDVLSRIKKLPVEQQMEAVTRLFGKDWGGAIAKLANGVEEYRRQIELANGASAKGSMSREFEARMQTTAAQWQVTKNRMSEVAVVIGGALLPAINDLLKDTAPAIEAFAKWAGDNPGFIKGVVGAALALSGLRVAASAARLAWLTLASPVLKAQQLFARFGAMKAIAGAGGQVGRFGGALLRVGSIVRAVGAVIAGVGGGPIALVVGALTVGALLVRKYWEPIKAFVGGVFQGIRDAVGPSMAALGQALAPLKPAWDAVSDAVGRLWNWIGKLLEPVTLSKGEFDKAANAGVQFGRLVGLAISVAVDNVTRLIRGISWIIGKADAFSSVLARIPILGAPAALGRNMLGAAFSPAPSTGAVALPGRPAGRAAAAVAPPGRPAGRSAAALQTGAPAPAGASRSGAAAGAQAAPVAEGPKLYQFNITQQPGESGEALARRVREELRRVENREHRVRLPD